MQSPYHCEQYTDRGHYVVMTRTAVLKDAQLARIADHLRRNAEDLVSSTNRPMVENTRIAGAMVVWAFNLVPLGIQSTFDY